MRVTWASLLRSLRLRLCSLRSLLRLRRLGLMSGVRESAGLFLGHDLIQFVEHTCHLLKSLNGRGRSACSSEAC